MIKEYKNIKLPVVYVIILLIFSCLFACTSPNDTDSINLSSISVPDDYEVELAAGPELVDYPMFGTVDERGRLFLFESTGNVYEKSEDAITNPQFQIKLLEDENGDGVYDKSTIFVDNIGFPQGGVFYNGSLYASSAPDLLKFTDTNGDGVADKREVLLTGWKLNINANSLIGPFMGPDGWLYLTNAIHGFDVITKEGERLQGETSRIWRVLPDGSGLEWISAGGMNNPVELTFTKSGEPIGTETYFTNPKAGQRDALVYWIKGGVYPKPNSNIQRDQLTLTGDLMPVVSKYSRVAPSGICRYRSEVFGNEFKDNLFSAQFNTHRILRHILIKDGASFKTQDEVFFESNNEDFHPTDILEDGDGSLLVVETGGWFIEGCPLSQVSKPELKGAIYRITKKGVPKVDDPFGNHIRWDDLSINDVVQHLGDPRPFVVDQAAQLLVNYKSDAIKYLKDFLLISSSIDVRTQIVFILYKIGTSEALEIVKWALKDEAPEVVVAAARSIGLAKDSSAVPKLIDLVVNSDIPEVQRQSATALGQIGDERAVMALLEAAEGVKDRFINHAIIYALISINRSTLTEKGLTYNSPDIKAITLIALDQMENSTLEVDQLLAFLNSKDGLLQETGLWVASHHPEWAEEIKLFLENKLEVDNINRTENKLFFDLLISFCGNENIQQFITNEIQESSSQKQLFLLDVMAECQIENWPKVWIELLGNQLAANTDSKIKSRILELIRLRNISSLEPQLLNLVDDIELGTSLKVEVIGALISLNPYLSKRNFDFLFSMLDKGVATPVRQRAATLLANSNLDEEQIMYLATNYLEQADAFILPRLISAFKGPYDKEIGEKLIYKLINSPNLDNYSEEYIKDIFAEYSTEIDTMVTALILKLKDGKADRLDSIETIQANIPKGDLERGRDLYFGKAICSTCHTIGNEGVNFGPDLTSIQKDRSAHDILEAILYPSVSFVREYESYRIVTNDREYRGIIREQTPEAIILETAPNTSVRISQKDILSVDITDVSMMPQGLNQLLSDQEMADLMVFLLGQDQDPNIDEEILR